MPKIKDLGIKVIPETMRPPEVGGGGCGVLSCGVSPAARACLPTQGCSDCTNQQFSICGGTQCGTVTQGCSDCTNQAFSICGGTQCGTVTQGCSDCTNQAFSICGGTQCGTVTAVGCSDCTVQAFSICGGTQCGTVTRGCSDCTFQQFSICGGTQCLPTLHGCGRPFTHCGCTVRVTLPCGPSVCGPSIPCGAFTGCGAISPVCGASIDPTIVQQPGVLTREQIATLKDGLRKQIEALEEHEKNIGPKTAEEIDAREKQINEELAQLRARRKELK